MTSYKKMILRNTLTICIIFSILFAVTLYMEMYFSTKKEYLINAQQNLRDIMNNMNASSSQVQDLAVIFQSNSDIKEYVENPDYPRPQKTVIHSYMYSVISNISTKKGMISIIKPGDEQLINSNSVMSLDYFCHFYGLPNSTIRNIITTTNVGSLPTPYTFFTKSGGKTYLTVLLADSLTFSKPYFIANVCDIEEFLTDLDDDSLILISGDSKNSNTVFYSSEGLSEKDINRILNKKNTLKYSIVADSTMNFKSLGDLTFTVILPKEKYLSRINHHLFFTLLSFLVLFLLSILISQRVSDRTYLPIQQLIDQISDLDTGTLENEFDAISSFISILKSRNTNLTDIVANNQNELKEKFINDLLHGHLTDEQTATGINSYLADSEALLPLATIIIEYNHEIASIAMDEGGNASSLSLVISTLFRQEFEKDGFFHFTALSPTSYCAVISCNDIASLKMRLKKLLLTIESDLSFDMYSSVSDYVDAWEDLPSAFFTTHFAHTTLKSQEISKKVYSRDEINNPVLYSYKIDNEIFSNCLRRERDQLDRSLDYLIKENFTSDEDYVKRQSQMSVLIFALCMRILTSINTNSETVFGKDYNIYLELRSCQTSRDFHRLLGFIFGKIIDYIENSQSPHKQNYQDSMLNYINENYSSNISLADLAKHMNLSQAYVSKLFKRLTDSNFKDYLSKVRIDQSKRLLVEHPEKSVREISALVGFYTPTTYSAVFTKHTGMTPSEYRRIHKKNR